MRLFSSVFNKKAVNKGITALSFTSEGISLAIAEFTNDQKTLLTHCEFIHTNKKKDTLKTLVKKYNLQDYDCYLVLAADDYRMITIEAPAVPDNELSDAVRWKISELVDFNIEEATVQYYPLPESGRANSENKLEVIATPKSNIQPLVDLCLLNELQLKVIDIEETCLRNLASKLPENENGIAVLHLHKSTGQILIEKQGGIYLSRKLALGYDRLGVTNSFMSDGQIELEQSSLALDIQRSFDYMESYYNFPPFSELAIIPIPENTQGILDFLNINHGITSRIMDLSTFIDGDSFLKDETQSYCASVIGATLRHELEA